MAVVSVAGDANPKPVASWGDGRRGSMVNWAVQERLTQRETAVWMQSIAAMEERRLVLADLIKIKTCAN